MADATNKTTNMLAAVRDGSRRSLTSWRVDRGSFYLTSPRFGSNVNAAEGIENGLTSADNRRVVHGRQVCRALFKRRVECADGDNRSVCLDPSCRPCVPREADAVEFLLH